jgi:hypothetical protein
VALQLWHGLDCRAVVSASERVATSIDTYHTLPRAWDQAILAAVVTFFTSAVAGRAVVASTMAVILQIHKQ